MTDALQGLALGLACAALAVGIILGTFAGVFVLVRHFEDD